MKKEFASSTKPYNGDDIQEFTSFYGKLVMTMNKIFKKLFHTISPFTNACMAVSRKKSKPKYARNPTIVNGR